MLFSRGLLETTPPGLRGVEKKIPPTPDCSFTPLQRVVMRLDARPSTYFMTTHPVSSELSLFPFFILCC